MVTDWSLVSPHLQKRGAFPRHDHHICFDSDSWKDCREIITQSSCDGGDYELWSVFDECVESCKENGASDPTTVECCPNVDLMAWLSREGWSHGESTRSCRVELEAPMSVSWRCARCVAVCEMREVTSVAEGRDVERVTETMRGIRCMKLARKIDESASDVVG